MKYFAYGSNMCTARLRQRVPGCQFYAVATLVGYTLKFHKRGKDGSAKCNALYTGQVDDVVIGVIFELDAAEKRMLDRIEGLGFGYDEATVYPVVAGVTVAACMYVAHPTAIDDTLLPYAWYRAFVVAGAHEHGFPASYCEMLEQVAVQ